MLVLVRPTIHQGFGGFVFSLCPTETYLFGHFTPFWRSPIFVFARRLACFMLSRKKQPFLVTHEYLCAHGLFPFSPKGVGRANFINSYSVSADDYLMTAFNSGKPRAVAS